MTTSWRTLTRFLETHFTNLSLRSGVAEARQAVREAQAIGEEPLPANSLVGMVVQRENMPGQDLLSEKELRDEALTFLL